MKPTLLIMAAGMGSRYGGLKQIDPIGPNGESLMEYGVYDAIRAGFSKVVFLFRDDIVQAFEKRYHKLSQHIEVTYAFQDLNPPGPVPYPTRTKPWGTGHAILSAAESIDQPFAVINADDFYGKGAYKIMTEFIGNFRSTEPTYAIVGYPIEKTLSAHGQVSRAILEGSINKELTNIIERTQVDYNGESIQYHLNGNAHIIPSGSLVSTNFWGFTPRIFDQLRQQFNMFIMENGQNPKAEFYIPFAVQELIDTKQASVRILTCKDDWMGVTYAEDKNTVINRINHLIQQGVYPDNLWS